MLEKYDSGLKALEEDLEKLANTLTTTIDSTRNALEKGDVNLADKIYHGDKAINDLIKKCMEEDMALSMLQEPVARDWRNLMATLKILSDLERIADHCADISYYILVMDKEGTKVELPEHLLEMYDIMVTMVREVLKGYFRHEPFDQKLVKDKDDMVDALFHSLLKEFAVSIRKAPDKALNYIFYTMIVKYIERMADHSSNIAEWIGYRDTSKITL
jgi:phosphate transport system protein